MFLLLLLFQSGITQVPNDIYRDFKFLRKCLIYKMLFMTELKPTLNKQSDWIREKLFTVYNFFVFAIIILTLTFFALVFTYFTGNILTPWFVLIYVNFIYHNLKMISGRSKARFLSLVFNLKCVSKHYLVCKIVWKITPLF